MFLCYNLIKNSLKPKTTKAEISDYTEMAGYGFIWPPEGIKMNVMDEAVTLNLGWALQEFECSFEW